MDLEQAAAWAGGCRLSERKPCSSSQFAAMPRLMALALVADLLGRCPQNLSKMR